MINNGNSTHRNHSTLVTYSTYSRTTSRLTSHNGNGKDLQELRDLGITTGKSHENLGYYGHRIIVFNHAKQPWSAHVIVLHRGIPCGHRAWADYVGKKKMEANNNTVDILCGAINIHELLFVMDCKVGCCAGSVLRCIVPLLNDF